MVVNKTYHIAGFLSAFCPRGGKMRDCMDYWGGGGASKYLCTKYDAN